MSFRGFSGGKDDSSAAKSPAASGVSLVQQPAVTSRAEAYIGRGTKITGAMAFPGPVEIDCQVEGEIEAPDRIVIGEAGQIHARIRGGEVIIKGAVQGDIIATKRLVLKKPAKVAGNIAAPVLVIEEGVLFEGKCSMLSAEGAVLEPRTPQKGGVVSLKAGQEKVA